MVLGNWLQKRFFAVILESYLAKREVYIVWKTGYELIKKGRGNGGEQRQRFAENKGAH